MKEKDHSKRKEIIPKELPFSDAGRYSTDSNKLRYLMMVYRDELEKGQKRATKAFWNQAKKLNKKDLQLNTGLIVEQISQKEMWLLEEAKNGSIKAIRKLIEGSPEIIRLPFVADKMIEVLSEYKISAGSLSEIRQVTWPTFLPDRRGGRLHISDESLRMKIIELMERPINGVLNELIRRRVLVEHGYKGALSNADLPELIRQVKNKGHITKELACQILESILPVNRKKIRNIRIRERSGRPPLKIP